VGHYARQQFDSGDDRISNDWRQLWGVILEERGEAIEVGECVVRPIAGY
jgi:hypothetical protein